MKINLNKRWTEANIQAEFYHQCRLNNINCYLEYKYEKSRFDIVLYDDKYNVYLIIEIKSKIRLKVGEYQTKQSEKYSQYNIPILFIFNMTGVTLAINYILQNKEYKTMYFQ